LILPSWSSKFRLPGGVYGYGIVPATAHRRPGCGLKWGAASNGSSERLDVPGRHNHIAVIPFLGVTLAAWCGCA
jgi:hypothetical protein